MKQVSIGRAEACANIALAKYWGKSPRGDNLTAVPSLSLTLDALRTRTEVRFDFKLQEDHLLINGERLPGRPLDRACELLTRVRALSGETRHAAIHSVNNFPTAAGLASSASGFAALAVAAAQAAGLELNRGQLSAQARKSSASAARSLFSGFSTLEAEADEAQAFMAGDHWNLVMIVGVVASGPKEIGSTGGMLHTERTSPYFPAWKATAPQVYDEVKNAIFERDFERLANAMEHSTRLMHATMLTSVPPVLYLQGPTIDLMHEVSRKRSEGMPVAYTMDAGPNIKLLTTHDNEAKVRKLLSDHPGVEFSIPCRPGPAACTLCQEGSLNEASRTDGSLLELFRPGRTANVP